MRLEIQDYLVSDVRFGKKTCYSNGVLTIEKQALIDMISDDPTLQEVDIQVAKPGEETRIVNVLELSEPRVKPTDRDYYPGMYGPLRRAGEGKTNALKGIAIVETGFMPGLFGGIVDMSGPASFLTPYSRTINICISAIAAPSVGMVGYGIALKMAGMKTAVYLANTTLDQAPSRVNTYDLTDQDVRDKGLPRIAYLYQLHNHGEAREPFLYGTRSHNFYSTILHPNEILDGALVSFHYNTTTAIKNPTYSIVNHPIILDLYAHHGKDVNFVGVVIAPEPPSLTEKKRTAIMAANLLKEVLGAEGVIISKEGGGHTDVDIMENCTECERLGIKTVLIDNEWLGPDGTGELPLLSIARGADAMVSVGNFEEVIDIPAMRRVIGGDRMPDIAGSTRQRLRIPVCLLSGAISQLGFTYLKTEVL